MADDIHNAPPRACKRCGKIKPVSDYIWSKKWQRYTVTCNDCVNAGRRARYVPQRSRWFWTPESIEAVRKCVAAQMTVAEAAAALGKPETSIRECLYRHLPAELRFKRAKSKPRPYLHSPHVEAIRNLAAERKTNAQIAAALHLTVGQVAGIIFRRGIVRGVLSPQRWDQQRLSEIARLSAAGLSAEFIARRLREPPGTIRRVMSEYGLFARPKAVTA